VSDYKFHKYADLYPLASEDELSRLTEDIKKNGLANPITLHEGQILDGRNRYIACQSAKVKPRFNNWDCLIGSWANGWKDVSLSVISQNSHRRHLNTSQLAMVAAGVAGIFQEDAKKRELAGVKTDPGAILPQGKSTDLAAKTVGGVSGRTVRDAVKVQKESPELAAQVLKGDITVAQAKKELSPAPPKDSKPPAKQKMVAGDSSDLTPIAAVEKTQNFVNNLVGPMSLIDTAWFYAHIAEEFKNRAIQIGKTLREQGSVSS
jgi:hypothetical protein